MKITKNKLFIVCIIFFIVIFLFYILLQTRKCYVFYDINGVSKSYFTDSQLKELDKSNAILALAIGNVMYIKRNDVSFYIFSLKDFDAFKLHSIKVNYDEKEKIFNYNLLYDMNFENPNFEQKISYKVNNNIISGYKKSVIPPFMNFKYCWIDFYDLFKWKHNKIGNEFAVKLTVEYSLDSQEFRQELNYKVKCEESYPANLLQGLFR